jgi:hypothetical protein
VEQYFTLLRLHGVVLNLVPGKCIFMTVHSYGQVLKGKVRKTGLPWQTGKSFRPIPGSVGLQYLACLGCGFESRLGHESLSFVSIVCCQVEASALGRTLVLRSSAECGVSEYDLETAKRRRLWSTGAVKP